MCNRCDVIKHRISKHTSNHSSTSPLKYRNHKLEILMIAVGQLQMFLKRKLSKRSSNNNSSSRCERVENRDMNHNRQQQKGIDRSHLFSNTNNEDRREYRNQILHLLHHRL